MTEKFKRYFTEITIILVTVFLSALITNEIRADKLALFPHYVDDSFCSKISLNEFQQIKSKNFRGLIFDARPHLLFRENHLTAAKNFPVSQFEFFYQFYFADVPSDTPIFVYGRTLSSAYDLELAYRLYLKGYKNITVLV